MPYLHTCVSTKLNPEQIDTLRQSVRDLITILPRKTYEVTMIHFDDEQVLSLNETDVPAAFIELRLLGESPLDAKQKFFAAYVNAVTEVTGIDSKHIYCNAIELNEWGSCGDYRRL